MTAGLNLHASCVALGADRGLLILGPSGAGKSGLALQLMALGAALVADDRVEVTPDAGRLLARAPAPLSGLIEARGVGLLRPARVLAQAQLVLAVDLGHEETDRLPPRRHLPLAGLSLPVVHASRSSHFPAALLCYLEGERWE